MVASARKSAEHPAARSPAGRDHLAGFVVLAGAAVLSGAFAAVLATVMLLIASPADQRMKVLAVLAAFYVLMLAGLGWGLRRALRAPQEAPVAPGTLQVARLLEAVLRAAEI